MPLVIIWKGCALYHADNFLMLRANSLQPVGRRCFDLRSHLLSVERQTTGGLPANNC